MGLTKKFLFSDNQHFNKKKTEQKENKYFMLQLFTNLSIPVRNIYKKDFYFITAQRQFI